MKHTLKVAAACTGVALAVTLLSWTTYFSSLNSSAYDFTLRLAGALKPSSPTVIVAIDEESLGRLGQWPWSRDKLANLIDRVQAGGPRVIGIDILLDDRSPDEASDDALASAISRTPAIVLETRLAPDAGTTRWLKPNPKFVQPHVRLGHVHADPVNDAISRRIWTAKVDAGVVVPAFSLQTLRVAGFEPKGDFESRTATATVLRPQAVNIRFIGGRQSFPFFSAARVLEGRIPPDEFKDRIVLIGLTADGLGDQWFTPFSTTEGQTMSGVEIHANAIDTFFAQRAIAEASELTLFLSVWLVTFGLRSLNRHRRFEGLRFYGFAVAMLPLSVALSWALLKFGNTWLPFPPLWAAVVLVVPGLEVLEMIRVNRDLDSKIGRLSIWDAALRRQDRDPDVRRRVLAELPSGVTADGWLSALDAAEAEFETRSSQRQRLLDPDRRNARWRLKAIDFFNEDLVRFLSFNNAILGSIEDVIIVADPAGRVVYQNPAAQRLPGYSDSPPFAPLYISSLLDGRSFVMAFGSVFSEGQTTTLRFVPSQEGRSHYNVTLAPIAKSGVVISLHDTTAQYELDQAKNDMVSLVSHELRTPLTSIRGYSDMLVKYDLVAEKGKPFLATIIDESRRLNGLIQSFLDVAYIESGRQKLTVTEFEVGPVLNDMLSILGPLAAEKQIRIEPPGSLDGARVRADRLLLYQALSNLVTNAIKYSPSGTTVRLNVSNGDGRVRFQIADQGCGIPADETGRVFEKFYRRANKETREQSGFGLGLAFVKEVAMKHGGDVIVESEVGKGSLFTLWIPN